MLFFLGGGGGDRSEVVRGGGGGDRSEVWGGEYQTHCMLAVACISPPTHTQCGMACGLTCIFCSVVCRSGMGFSELRLPAVHRVLGSAQEARLSHLPSQVSQSGRVEVGLHRNQTFDLHVLVPIPDICVHSSILEASIGM